MEITRRTDRIQEAVEPMIGIAYADMLEDADDLVTVADAARELKVWPNHLARAVNMQTIASCVISNVRYISLADARAWAQDP